MSSSSLIRLAGLAAIGSGVLGVIGDLLALVVDLEDPLSAATASYDVPIIEQRFENVLRCEGFEEEVFVNSAETSRWQVGSPPDERAQRSARLRGL